MLSAQHRRPNTSAPTDGSRTIIIHDNGVGEDDNISSDESAPDAGSGSTIPNGPPGVLRLRGGPRSRPQVAWKEDVVDNEGAGKKKSKICCIYHKPKRFDESSDESDSEDSDCEGHGHSRHNHSHEPGPGTAGNSGLRDRETGGIAELQVVPGPNAYERTPKSKGDKGKSKSW